MRSSPTCPLPFRATQHARSTGGSRDTAMDTGFAAKLSASGADAATDTRSQNAAPRRSKTVAKSAVS